MWQPERMLPHSCSRSLRSVIAISRLSDTWTDKTKLERLSERNEQLIRYVVDTHHKVQDEQCLCNPTSYNIVLNGVSSNIVADANSALAGKTEIFRRVLDELSQTPDDGIVILAVHSTDGLWTNIHAFMRFFAPYVETLSLEYMVHEGFGRHRLFPLRSIYHAVNQVLCGQAPPAFSTDAHKLVGEWGTIAYSKLQQRMGNMGVRVQLQQRRNTTILDAESEQIEAHRSPQTRVVRIIRSGGTDLEPRFRQDEEQRYTLQKEDGHIRCPEKMCSELFASIETTIVHILNNIMRITASDRRCPLCPPHISKWNFIYLADGIFHLLRHLGPPNSAYSQEKRLAQCPYCFTLMASPSAVYAHIESIHLMAFQVNSAAISLRIITEAVAKENDATLGRAIENRSRTDLAALPGSYQTIAWDVDARISWTTSLHNEPRKTAIQESAKPLTIAPPTDLPMRNALRGTPLNQSNHQKWFKQYSDGANMSGNQRTKMKLASIQRDSRDWVLCPLAAESGLCGCGEFFETCRDLCNHIWQVLRRMPEDRHRQCPWCPIKPDIILKHADAIQQQQKRSNDLRHLRRHFPPEVSCNMCDHISRTEGDMWKHKRTVHYPWHCKITGCDSIFATQEELGLHSKLEH